MPPGDAVAPLIAYLRERYPLSDEHAALVRSVAVPRTLEPGEHVQRAGDVAEHTSFVVKGLLRAYLLEEDGREHILRFAAEGWWLGDPESARTGVPSRMFFEAIEPSVVLSISYRDHERMMAAIPGHAAAFAQGMQRLAAARERWIIGTLSASAEERYREFLATYPAIAARVPQRMIASYLGLAPETLSRVRRQLANKPPPARG
jgi:CRP-like cAMP-binding protein